MKTISQVIEEQKNFKSKPQLVGGWQALLPKGSRWNPGDPGNPGCTICEGIGYLRMDLPLSHPDFGKLFLCECTQKMPAQRPSLSAGV